MKLFAFATKLFPSFYVNNNNLLLMDVIKLRRTAIQFGKSVQGNWE